MAFTLTFPTARHRSPATELAAWLTERGEPHLLDGDVVTLRAVPMRFVSAEGHASLQCQVEVTSSAPLSRMVDVVFDVSVRAGADVHLAGRGPVVRADLWMELADEQDRLRLGEALTRAAQLSSRDEVLRRLWGVLAAARPGHDDRWDATSERVVELMEVGEGVSLDDARWHAVDPQLGDVIAIPVRGTPHCLAWRWLSEAYPGLAVAQHSLH